MPADRRALGYVLASADLRYLWVGARKDSPTGLAPLTEPLPRPPPVYADRLTAQQIAHAIYKARGLLLKPVKARLP